MVEATPLVMFGRSASIRSSILAGSAEEQTSLAPAIRVAMKLKASPPTQNHGEFDSRQSRSVSPRSPFCRAMLRSTWPWVWVTPLGALVEPEVWMTNSGSAGLTCASATATRLSSCAPSASSPAVPNQTWRSTGSPGSISGPVGSAPMASATTLRQILAAIVGRGDQIFGIRAQQHAANFMRGGQRADRHRDCTDPGNREESEGEVDAVAQQHRHPAAPAQASRDQRRAIRRERASASP